MCEGCVCVFNWTSEINMFCYCCLTFLVVGPQLELHFKARACVFASVRVCVCLSVYARLHTFFHPNNKFKK